MNYTKPQVVALGPAVRVIEQTVPPSKTGSTSDGSNRPKILNPAYDLDE
jgi:hypothetical protein